MYLPLQKTEVYVSLSEKVYEVGDTQDPKTENNVLCLWGKSLLQSIKKITLHKYIVLSNLHSYQW